MESSTKPCFNLHCWSSEINDLSINVIDRLSSKVASRLITTHCEEDDLEDGAGLVSSPVGVAANRANNWAGTTYVFSIVGALVSDSYWGRYKACTIFQIIFLAVSSN